MASPPVHGEILGSQWLNFLVVGELVKKETVGPDAIVEDSIQAVKHRGEVNYVGTVRVVLPTRRA